MVALSTTSYLATVIILIEWWRFKSGFRQIRFTKIPEIQFLLLDQIQRCNRSIFSKKNTYVQPCEWPLCPRGLCEHLSVCQRPLPVLVLTKTWSGQHHNASASDVISVFFFYKNASWCTKQTHFAMTSSFCSAKNASWCLYCYGFFHYIGCTRKNLCSYLPHNWINKNSKN